MVVLIDGVRYRLVTPESEAALEQTIRNNYQHIFGPDSFYFDVKTKIRSKAGIVSIPDAYVIFFDPNAKWCVLEVELASHPIYEHLIPQLAKFNQGVDDSSTRKKLVEKLYEIIGADDVLKAKIKRKIGSGEVYKFVSDLISETPEIVVAIDEQTDELDEALRNIRGEVKVLEFKIFHREHVSDEINAYVFSPIFTDKRITQREPAVKGDAVPTKTLTGSMVGQRVYEEAKNNGNFWVGRMGGEEEIIEDIKSGRWRKHSYRVRSKPSSRPQHYITSKRFAELVNRYRGN